MDYKNKREMEQEVQRKGFEANAIKKKIMATF